jgi:hypothetical protein
MTAILLALALAAPPASPLERPQPVPVRTPGLGRVVQATKVRAYLDVGAENGLAVGEVLSLRRGEQAAGHCTVETVGPTHATCTGAAAKPGDTFRLGPPAVPPAKAVVLPPLLDDQELARRAAAVEAAPQPLVVFKPAPGAVALAPPRATVAEVALGGAVWNSTGFGPWEVATLDAAVHGASIGPLSLDLDLSAERWISHTGDVFRPKEDTRLYVWQAQLGWAPPAGGLAISAGRILPWTVPGATVMDGAMAGWRQPGWEAGVFGGLVPRPDTLNPGSDRATGGGYWAVDKRWGKDLVFRDEGRVAWVRSPELGSRVELETAASVHSGAALDLYGSARFGAGGKLQAPGYLDQGRLELGVRPAARISLSGGFEYGGLAVPWLVEPPVTTDTRNRRGDLSATLDLGRLRVVVLGGGSSDAASGVQRTWGGGELQLPRLFTPRLDLSLGYLEELGWLKGRSAWVQAVAKPWEALRLIARASWSHETLLGVDQDEESLSLSAVAELSRHLGLRFTALGTAAFSPTVGDAGAVPLGLTASAALYAVF